MPSKKEQVIDLEAELVRLNRLVRQRRAQLIRLKTCPHKDCECRVVWRNVVEKDLARQVGRIRRHVKPKSKPRPIKRKRS